MSNSKQRDLAYPNLDLPYRGLPAEIRVKIWKLVLHQTVVVFPECLYSNPPRNLRPEDLVGFVDRQKQYILLHFRETWIMAIHLLQINKELHCEVISSLSSSIVLDLRHLPTSWIKSLTITPPIRQRLKGFLVNIPSPKVRDLSPTQYVYPPHLAEPISVLLDLLDRSMSTSSQPLQCLELETHLHPLPDPLLATARNYLGRKLERDFSNNDILAVTQRFESEFKDYCALAWLPVLWKGLLDRLSQGVIREVAVYFKSSSGLFGKLVELHGVEHVFGFNLADHDLVGQLRVNVELHEEHSGRACGLKVSDGHGQRQHDRLTVVRLRV